jgi:hypothetical protein
MGMITIKIKIKNNGEGEDETELNSTMPKQQREYPIPNTYSRTEKNML